MGEGSAMPTDPHHTPIITQPSSSQPQRKQKSRRPKEKDTQAPQSNVPSDPTNIADEAIIEEPSIQLKELMDFCTKLQQRAFDLENTKTAQAQEITSLKKRVKKLEKKGGSRTYKLKRLYKIGKSARVVSSEEASLGDQEDVSKQGRKIYDIDADEDIPLENVHDAEMFDVNDLEGDEVVFESERADKDVNLSVDEVTLSQALADLKKQAPTPIVSSQQPTQVKDKGKGKIIEEEPVKKMSKKELLNLDEELAFKLQAKEDEEERLAREKEKSSKIGQRLFAKSKKSLSVDAEKVHYLYTLGKKEKHFAAKRSEEKRNRPPTKAQQRNLLGLKDFKIFLELLLLRLCSLGSNSKWRFTSTRGTVDGVEKTYPPITAEEKLARKNELKVRGTVLMALLNEHQLKFNTYKCAKTLMEAIEKRLQKLISRLEILGETISQEDMNLKFLRSLPSEWKTHTLIRRNKPNLDTLSMDDLYKNLKIYETEIDADNLKEMDLKWQMTMLTMRPIRFLNKTGRKINTNGSETIGFNKSKVECYNCHKRGHFTREYRALRENKNREPIRRNVIVETTETKPLVAQDGLGSSSSDSESQLNVGAYKAGLEFVEVRLDVYKKNEVVFEEDIKILKLNIKLRDNALTELRKKFEKAEKERDDLKLTLEKFGNLLIFKQNCCDSSIGLMNSIRTSSNVFNKAHTHIRRPFNKSTTNKNSNLKEKVNTVKGNVTTAGPKAVVSDNKGYEANAIKASNCLRFGDKAIRLVLDHVSRHKGDPKGGRITGKGKTSTGKLDFEDVYFVKELKFNLFSVSQMCDKKNSVLFTDTECVVLSPDFKLLDENHVLLRVPRKDNMYSVDLKNIVPSGGLTCLFAKATLDESNLWHRRLGHINFKTMNKLVRGNLVRGYSTNSKAFRVFNSRTRIVEENMHVKFSEETPNIVGNGPNWLFDIDALTKSMNYKPVVAGNQTNGNAGTKENIDAGQAGKKIVPDQEYILLPLLTSNPSLSKSSKDSPDAGFKPSGEEEKMDAQHPENEDSNVPNTEEPRVNQEQDKSINSTNNINTVSSTVNTASIKDNAVDENIVYGCIDDPNMPNLEEIVYSNDDEEVGAEADMNNLATTVPVSPIPNYIDSQGSTTLKKIIGDIHSAPQTRRMTKSVTEHVEPKKAIQALTYPSWIEAMQDELLQFKLQKVWTLVDLPYGKRSLVTKWVYRNKKDDRDYDEVFAPIARIEAIRLFLAYASFMNFIVYQMDVKSEFLYGTIEEEVYVCQPPGFEDPEFPNKIYKRGDIDIDFVYQEGQRCYPVSTGKQKDDGIFISQDKYVADILKKFDFAHCKESRHSLWRITKPLLKDGRSCRYVMIPVTPNTSHLHVVKRIFRYLKGHPKLGLWYPRDSPFDLVAFSDSDYAGASLDRKSIIGGCQFLGRSEDNIAIVKNQCFHLRLSTLKFRHHFIRDSYEKRLIQVIKIHTDHNVADLLTKAFDVCRFSTSVTNETVIKEWEDRMERAATTASSLEAEQDSDSGPRCQDTILGGAEAQIRFEAASKQSNDPPLSRVNTLGSGEDSMKLKELMELCIKLPERALDLA
ncbi:ribonuclease H-like domain-containing protein [Tanacetum coccineum]